MTNVHIAQGYIRSHGFEAFITPDGLAAMMSVVIGDNVMQYRDDQDDNYFEEPEVFPVTNGMVDMRSIRAWLGY